MYVIGSIVECININNINIMHAGFPCHAALERSHIVSCRLGEREGMVPGISHLVLVATKSTLDRSISR